MEVVAARKFYRSETSVGKSAVSRKVTSRISQLLDKKLSRSTGQLDAVDVDVSVEDSAGAAHGKSVNYSHTGGRGGGDDGDSVGVETPLWSTTVQSFDSS